MCICVCVISRADTWKADIASRQLLSYRVWQERYLLRPQHRRVSINLNLQLLKISIVICLFPLHSAGANRARFVTNPSSFPLSESFPLTSTYIYHSFSIFWPYLNFFFSFCLTQVRQRVSAGSSSCRREQRLRDVGLNTV